MVDNHELRAAKRPIPEDAPRQTEVRIVGSQEFCKAHGWTNDTVGPKGPGPVDRWTSRFHRSADGVGAIDQALQVYGRSYSRRGVERRVWVNGGLTSEAS